LTNEARVCIAEGEILGNPRRVRRFTRGAVLQDTRQRWQELFSDLPSAMANSGEIARRCSLTLVLGKPQLPDFRFPQACRSRATSASFRCEGLEERLQQLYPNAAQREAQRPRYLERLEFEIKPS
jgi:DNA polymerase-3 subunit alpha